MAALLVCGCAEGLADKEADFIGRFRYETRHSTNEFCRQLVAFRHQASFEYSTIAEELRDQPW